MKNEYQEQAEKFLQETNTKMSIVFHDYAKYFEDDKEERNLYKVTLKRNKKQYTFTFGDSIMNTEQGNTPNEYDILSCLNIFEGSFEDFCNEFDFDTDSRKAERIYKATIKQAKGLKRLFDDEQIQSLSEIW